MANQVSPFRGSSVHQLGHGIDFAVIALWKATISLRIFVSDRKDLAAAWLTSYVSLLFGARKMASFIHHKILVDNDKQLMITGLLIYWHNKER